MLGSSAGVSWPGLSVQDYRFRDLGWGRQGVCKTEEISIPQMLCKIEWKEECSTNNKKVGEKVVYEKECKDREVKDCKWVQFVHPKYPR